MLSGSHKVLAQWLRVREALQRGVEVARITKVAQPNTATLRRRSALFVNVLAHTADSIERTSTRTRETLVMRLVPLRCMRLHVLPWDRRRFVRTRSPRHRLAYLIQYRFLAVRVLLHDELTFNIKRLQYTRFVRSVVYLLKKPNALQNASIISSVHTSRRTRAAPCAADPSPCLLRYSRGEPLPRRGVLQEVLRKDQLRPSLVASSLVASSLEVVRQEALHLEEAWRQAEPSRRGEEQ